MLCGMIFGKTAETGEFVKRAAIVGQVFFCGEGGKIKVILLLYKFFWSNLMAESLSGR